MHILKNNKLPILPKGEGSHNNRRRFFSKSKKLRLIICNLGKDHLWIRQSHKRIPMVNEARYIASLLHGSEHRSKKKMSEIILKQNKIYSYSMKKYINEIVDECLFCCPKI